MGVMRRVLGALRLWLGVPLALGAAVPLVARLLEPHLQTPVPQVAAFATAALPIWALATLLLLGRGRARIALTLLMVAALAVQVWWWLPTSADRSAASSGASSEAPSRVGGTPVVVMSQNAEIGAADPAAIVRLVRERRVDLLVVTEVTAELDAALDADGLRILLPHRNVHPGPGAAGTGTWSRWPVRAEGHIDGIEFSAPRTLVDLPDGRKLKLTGVHPRSPQTVFVPQWRRELAAIATDARSTAGIRIYAGDFNSGRAHSGFRAITAAGLADAADSRTVPRFGFTWPADRRFPPLTRIDHVLVTPESIEVRSLSVVSVPGTDHRGLVASLIVRPGVRPQ